MNVVQIVLNGEHHVAVPEAFMPSFGHAYSDTEIAAVANYVLARFGGLPPRIDARDVAELRWQGGSTEP